MSRATLAHWSSPARRETYRRAYVASLGLWPVPFKEREVRTSFGPTHVVVSGVAGGDPVVLLHAASLSATQWHPQVRDLAEAHRVYAVDIMGDIGLSTAQRPVVSRADAAGWLSGVLDGLGLERAVFVGSSFGGFHSASFAAREPARVRALALLAPAATVQPFRTAAKLAIRAGSLVPLPFTVRPGLKAMMQGRTPEEPLVRQMEVGVAGFRYGRGNLFPTELDDATLARIVCPSLVLLGGHEKIYDSERAATRARRALRSAEVAILEGAGHLLGMQQPELVNRRLSAFLARV